LKYTKTVRNDNFEERDCLENELIRFYWIWQKEAAYFFLVSYNLIML